MLMKLDLVLTTEAGGRMATRDVVVGLVGGNVEGTESLLASRYPNKLGDIPYPLLFHKLLYSL